MDCTLEASVVRPEQDLETTGKQTKPIMANTHRDGLFKCVCVCVCVCVYGTLSIHAADEKILSAFS